MSETIFTQPGTFQACKGCRKVPLLQVSPYFGSDTHESYALSCVKQPLDDSPRPAECRTVQTIADTDENAIRALSKIWNEDIQ